MTVVAPRAQGAVGPDSLAGEIRAALEALPSARPLPGRARLVSVTLPVEAPDPLALFATARAHGHEPTLWLQPAARSALLGVGSAWSVSASGPERFGQVEGAWSELVASANVGGAGSPRRRGPMLLGGFGFADRRATTSAWRGFEEARFVLPRALLASTPAGSWLTISAVVDRDAAIGGAVDAAADAWREVASAGAAPPGPATDTPTAEPSQWLRLVVARPSPAEWRASVARLAGAVGRGRVDKVVLTRAVDLSAATSLDVSAVVGRLRTDAPESTIFAVCRGERTFLGASPELLISLRGRDFRSVAMAGSVGRGSDPASDEALAYELLESDKEREEHAVVVDMLRATLAPLAERLDVAPGPTVLRLRHLQHLVTPLEGRLREPEGVLGLVGRLHPTPAVGGTPRDLALELIAQEERHERGWYAGPLGWVDGRGDGEFVVALRCGVVEGRSATLLAGCGIVADSDPDREWDESATKLLALGSALGQVRP